GVEAVGRNADGDIEIKPDRQGVPARAVAATGELLVRGPLHEFEEAEIARMLAQLLQRGVVGNAPFLRPLPPGALQAPAQQLEAGEVKQGRRTLGPKPLQRRPPLRARM